MKTHNRVLVPAKCRSVDRAVYTCTRRAHHHWVAPPSSGRV